MLSPTNDRLPAEKPAREPRFKPLEDQTLHCRISSDETGGKVWEGAAVDVSTSGMRLLTPGRFQQGQAIRTELLTSKSHGSYRGCIRRVEPWVDGQSILGCSLSEAIPKQVLRDLADEGIIDRRSDGRFRISRPAKISWPLAAEEFDIELQDYSLGGMKFHSNVPIPDDTRLRLRFEAGGHEVVLEARLAWTHPCSDGWISGVEFTQLNAPEIVADTFGRERSDENSSARAHVSTAKMGSLFAFFAVVAFFGYVLFSN